MQPLSAPCVPGPVQLNVGCATGGPAAAIAAYVCSYCCCRGTRGGEGWVQRSAGFVVFCRQRRRQRCKRGTPVGERAAAAILPRATATAVRPAPNASDASHGHTTQLCSFFQPAESPVLSRQPEITPQNATYRAAQSLYGNSSSRRPFAALPRPRELLPDQGGKYTALGRTHRLCQPKNSHLKHSRN